MLTSDTTDSVQEGLFARPVGDGNYVVQEGECVESIAFSRGLLWQTVWNHPRNAALRQADRNPNILLPGDRLYVPELDQKTVDAGTEQRHAFCVSGALSKIQIRLLKWVKPVGMESQEAMQSETADESSESQTTVALANVPYVVLIDGQSYTGHTDAEGWVVQTIAPDAQRGSLIVEPGTGKAYEMTLLLGGLDPIDAASGIWQRLANLGFACGAGCAPDSSDYRSALEAFQTATGLEASGLVDADTRAKLKDLHCS